MRYVIIQNQVSILDMVSKSDVPLTMTRSSRAIVNATRYLEALTLTSTTADGSDNECSVLETSCMICSSSSNSNICSGSITSSEETVWSECNALQLAWTGS